MFDGWIANVDRAAGKNLILYRNAPHEKYDWYLIDHGLALYGAPAKWERYRWDTAHWQRLWLFHHVAEGMARLLRRFEYVEPMIGRIEAIPDAQLAQLVAEMPPSCYSEEERALYCGFCSREKPKFARSCANGSLIGEKKNTSASKKTGGREERDALAILPVALIWFLLWKGCWMREFARDFLSFPSHFLRHCVWTSWSPPVQ